MAGRKPKFGVKQTERLHWRMTEEQKQLVELPAELYGVSGGTVDFWKPIMETVSLNAIQLKEGKITPEEFRQAVGESVTDFVMSLEAGVSDSVKLGESVKVNIEGETETKT